MFFIRRTFLTPRLWRPLPRSTAGILIFNSSSSSAVANYVPLSLIRLIQSAWANWLVEAQPIYLQAYTRCIPEEYAGFHNLDYI
jgi:hypothetical protein